MGRPFVIQMLPQMPADGSQGITEGGLLFDVPAVVANRQFVREKQLGDDGHQAEETEETGRGAFDSPVRPLALGFETQERHAVLRR